LREVVAFFTGYSYGCPDGDAFCAVLLLCEHQRAKPGGEYELRRHGSGAEKGKRGESWWGERQDLAGNRGYAQLCDSEDEV